ncbi:MAG: ribosomal protein S18-alanine N-acetyltransferase [Desulfuromonadaceae bacterium]|nr:ribosomal protein S18-alanine N-acetyltransferase [Desulfuromonadaceae bacterium]
MKTDSTIFVRALGGADIDAVLKIEAASNPVPWQRDHFCHEIEANYSWPFVAVENGRVVGYVCMMSLFEEAQILNIAVEPEQRGKGIARILMGHALQLGIEKGADVMALEVRASNRRAISLYENLGFTRTGVRALYYEGVEDAILMEKPLKENPLCSLPL